jgi:nitroreductase
VNEAYIDSFVSSIVATRGGTGDALKGYRDMMVGSVVKGPISANQQDWAARQAYIALGNLMTAAAMLGLDTCPMEGFVPAEFDKILGLEGSGYATTVLCPVGYRAEDDLYATLPKVRFPKEAVIRHI